MSQEAEKVSGLPKNDEKGDGSEEITHSYQYQVDWYRNPHTSESTAYPSCSNLKGSLTHTRQ